MGRWTVTVLRRPSGTASLFLLLLWILPGGAAGQDASEGLRGIVRDAITSNPIEGAIVRIRETGPSDVTARDGTFELPRPARGRMEVTVEALGYRTLTLQVSPSGVPESLEIALEPAPLDVEGLDVDIETRFPLFGRVTDEISGEGLLGADVSLPYGSRRTVVVTREGGRFELEDLAPGVRLVRVSRLGYVPVLLRVPVPTVMDTLPIPLEPDSAVLRGVARMRTKLRSRRRAVATMSVRSLSRREVANGRWVDTRHLLRRLGVRTGPCPASVADFHCVRVRGGLQPVQLCIDGRVAHGGLVELDTYAPSDIYLIVSFARGAMIEVLTVDYMEREALRSRPPLSGCPDPRL